MKKLLIIAVSAFTLSTFAQTGHQVKSFINDRIASLVVSNASGTITVPGFTNLNSNLTVGQAGFGTNYLGSTWTNKDGSYIIETAANASATNDVSSINVFKDVPLWPDREMRAIPADFTASATTNWVSLATITIRAAGRSGKSGTLTFRFCPLYDGTNESTAAGQVIPIALTINGVTPVVLTTNLPQEKIIGAKALRLREVFNGDTGAGADAFITDINISGFNP